MFRKAIFIVASALIFFVLDQNWVYPLFFNHMTQMFGWVFASVLAGFEVTALIAEWNYLD